MHCKYIQSIQSIILIATLRVSKRHAHTYAFGALLFTYNKWEKSLILWYGRKRKHSHYLFPSPIEKVPTGNEQNNELVTKK